MKKVILGLVLILTLGNLSYAKKDIFKKYKTKIDNEQSIRLRNAFYMDVAHIKMLINSAENNKNDLLNLEIYKKATKKNKRELKAMEKFIADMKNLLLNFYEKGYNK